MARNLDDLTSVSDDTPAGATERREETAAPDRSDVAREDGAAAVEQRMQSPTMIEFKKRVANLRAMGQEKFIEQTREVARHILTFIKAAAWGPLPESIRPMNASDAQAKNSYLDSVDQLRDAEIADVTPKGAIVPDMSFDPAFPLSLVIKRGSSAVHVGVHWALWKTVEQSLAPEDAVFVRMVEMKTGLEQSIADYQFARTSLQEADIDLDAPRIFDEA